MERANSGEEKEVVLPKHLIEQIVARIPYPSIYKVRCLSKSWLRKFSPVSSIQNAEEKTLTTSFQKMVCDFSKHWPMGIFLSPIDHNREVGITHDLISLRQVIFPDLKFLPKEFPRIEVTFCVDGILVCKSPTSETVFYVANIFNQTWKVLCPRPDGESRWDDPLIVVTNKSLGTYKLILFCGVSVAPEPWTMQVYDSKSEAWTSKTILGSEHVSVKSQPAYHNGFLYMVISEGEGMGSIVRFNSEDGTSVDEFRLEHVDRYFRGSGIFYHDLLVCNAELFLTVISPRDLPASRILKVDLDALRVVEVAEPYRSTLDIESAPFSIGNLIIYLGVENGNSSCRHRGLHAYNVIEGKWSAFAKFSTIDGTETFVGFMEPGLNPFLAL